MERSTGSYGLARTRQPTQRYYCEHEDCRDPITGIRRSVTRKADLRRHWLAAHGESESEYKPNRQFTSATSVQNPSHSTEGLIGESQDRWYNNQNRLAQGFDNRNAPMETTSLSIRPSNVYGDTNVAGQATAILGDVHGGVNIQNATLLLGSHSVDQSGAFHPRVERYNQVLSKSTIETVITYNGNITGSIAGSSSKVELHWERREDLGSGIFGVVHREECSYGSQVKSRAVKVLRMRQLKGMQIDYKKEIGALLKLSDPKYVQCFVEFYSWYSDEENLYLSMQYFVHGDLRSHIGSGLCEHDAKQIGVQILEGLRIMHHLDIIHRDIKPVNIFVVRKLPTWWVKIGDFGICKSTATQHTNLRTHIGTEGYQAPEIAGWVATEKPGHYNAKCDVWSFGCLLYELLTCRIPFSPMALVQFCQDSSLFPTAPLYKASASPALVAFLQSVLVSNPRYRLTSEEAVRELRQWLQSFTYVPHGLRGALSVDRGGMYESGVAEPSAGQLLERDFYPDPVLRINDAVGLGLDKSLLDSDSAYDFKTSKTHISAAFLGNGPITYALPEYENMMPHQPPIYSKTSNNERRIIESDSSIGQQLPLSSESMNLHTDTKYTTPYGQALFSSLSRTMPTGWSGNRIIVSETFVIDMPYNSASVKLVPGATGDLDRMKKVLDLISRRPRFFLKLSKSLIDEEM